MINCLVLSMINEFICPPILEIFLITSAAVAPKLPSAIGPDLINPKNKSLSLAFINSLLKPNFTAFSIAN